MSDWNRRFIDLAFHIAEWSKDESKKVGSVIVDEDRRVVSLGYNGFPRGVNDDIKERHLRPAKYSYTIHSEQNALCAAAANGHPLKGCTIYSTFFPCCECSRAIIQSGIKKVVSLREDMDNERWRESFEVSMEMFKESGVLVEFVD